ncbi:MAG: hypothetical protein FD189_303 [Elusimicrobia bacterium]|nr:MAG: hypothetical protein FD154_103 [Elusimicrobiota bacterium]KAF0158036.1 MAG: hypothetical protein FD189_303 [Elusimicrobiota bacterium]
MPLFPPPEKQGEIKFFFAKGMSYRLRMAVIAAALPAGLAVQLFFSFWTGLVLLAIASLLGIVSGYDARPKLAPGVDWARVTPDEYFKVRQKAEALEKWDVDAFDFSNPRGMGVIVLMGIIGLAVYFSLAVSMALPDNFWVYPVLDAAVILMPLWITGVREYLKRDQLVIKIKHLEEMMRRLEEPSDVQVSPMLGLRSTADGKKVPEDARLMVKLVGAPEEFMGLQVQLSINSVKGTDHPYLYCVIIAKKGSLFFENYAAYKAPEDQGAMSGLFKLIGLAGYGPVYEPAPADDVEVLVIRQRADRNGGYSTDFKQAWKIVSVALDMARGLCAEAAKRGAAAA